MQGTWVDIRVSRYAINEDRPIEGRAFYRKGTEPDKYAARTGFIGLAHLAQFIYEPDTQRIIKNRHGCLEDLYEHATAYASLKYHENESVRKAFERAETLAALAGEE